MAVNRILLHLGCNCHRNRRLIQEAESVAEQIEAVIGDEIEFEIPCESRIVKKGFDLPFYVKLNAEPVTDLDEARPHVCHELRRISLALAGAADRLDMTAGMEIATWQPPVTELDQADDDDDGGKGVTP